MNTEVLVDMLRVLIKTQPLNTTIQLIKSTNLIHGFIFAGCTTKYELDDQIKIVNNVPILHVCPPKDSKVGILFLHGNQTNLGTLKPFTQHLNRDVHVVCPEYPGYGMHPIAQKSEKGCYESAQVAYDYMKEIGIETVHIVGNSLGSAIAIHLATATKYMNDIAGLILVSPFYSAKRVAADKFHMFGIEKDQIDVLVDGVIDGDLFGSNTKLRNYTGKLFIIHGAADKLINVDHAHDLYNECISTNKKIMIHPNEEHNYSDWPTLVFEPILAYISNGN